MSDVITRHGRHRPAAFLLLLLVLVCARLPSLYAAAEAPAASEPRVSRTHYSVSAGERYSVVTATVRVETRARGWHTVQLLPKSVVLRGAGVSGGQGYVEQTGSGYVARLRGRGSFSIRLDFQVHVREDGAAFQSIIPLVTSAATTIDFTSPRPNYVVQVSPDCPVERLDADGSTRVRIYPSGDENIQIRWLPAEAARPAEASFRVAEMSTATLSAGSCERQTLLNVDVRRGAVSSLAVSVPADSNVLEVAAIPAGTAVEEWSYGGNEGQAVLRIRLERALSGAAAFRIVSESAAQQGADTFILEPFAVRGAGRQTGRIRIAVASSFRVAEVMSENLRRHEVGGPLPDWIPGESTVTAGGSVSLAYEYHQLPASVRLRLGGIEPRLTADTASFVRLQAGVVELTSRISYSIENAPVDHLRLGLEDGLIPMAVEGPNVQGWELKDGELRVRLRSFRRGDQNLAVHCVQKLRRIDGVLVPHLRCLDAETQSGSIGVSAGEDVSVMHRGASGFTQVDVDELPAWLRERSPDLGYTYRRPGGELVVSTRALTPRLRVTGYGTATVSERVVEEQYIFHCSVEHQPLFGLTFDLPPDVSPTNVAGSAVDDWDYDAAADSIEVTFSEGVTGKTAIQLSLERQLPLGTEELTFAGVAIDGADEQEGWIGFITEGNLVLDPGDTRGVRSVAVDQVPEMVSARGELDIAYRWSAPDWSVDCGVRRLEPRIEGQTETALVFREGRVNVRSDVRFNIAKARVNELSIELPEGAAGVQVSGDRIRTRTRRGERLALALTEPVQGQYRCRLEFTLPVDGADGRFEYRGIRLPQARRQSGTIGVFSASPRFEIETQELRNASRAPDRPDIGAEQHSFLGAYSYSGADRALVFGTRGLGTAQKLALQASRLRLDSLVRQNGGAVSYLSCRLESADSQYASLQLPGNSTLWGSYIDGEAVKPLRRESGDILVPLREAPSDGPFEFQLIWSQPSAQVGMLSSVGLAAPELGFPVRDIGWNVYLPRHYQVLSAGGNMELMEREPWYSRGLPGRVKAVLEAAWPVLRPMLIVAVCIGTVILLVWAVRRIPYLRKNWFPVVLLLGIIAILAAMLMPALQRARQAATRTSALNDLKQIGSALQMYRNDHDGELPDSLRELVPKYLGSEKLLVSPVTKKPYIYNPDADIAENPAETPVAWDHPTEDGTNVLYGDWHGTFASGRRLAELQGPGGRPVRLEKDTFGVSGRRAEPPEEGMAKLPEQQPQKKKVTADRGRRAQESAEAAFERAMRLGDSYRKRGDYLAAREEYQRAKELKPGSSEPEQKLRRLQAVRQAGAEGMKEDTARTKDEEAARGREAVTRSHPAGALRSLARSLEEDAAEGWESTVAQNSRQRTLLGLVRGETGEARPERNTRAALDRDLLKLEGPPDEVSRVIESVKKLQKNMLEESRRITKARRERRAERAAERRAEVRRRMAELRAKAGGQAGTLSGSRAAGALPLDIRLPRAGTQAFPFRMEYGGTATARIRLTCIQTGLALVLQATIAAAVFVIIGAGAWRRPIVGLALAVAVALVLGVVMQAGGPDFGEFAATGLIAACLALPVVLGQTLLSGSTQSTDDN